MNSILPTIVYCATRQKDLDEVEISVNSVREYYPTIEIIIFTSFMEYTNNKASSIKYFDKPYYNFLDKISSLLLIRRKRILFLDGDTFLIDKINDLFSLLDKFELAVAHAPNRWTAKLDLVPDAFPEFNTGVLLFKRTFRVKKLLKKWKQEYKKALKQGIDFPSKDQPNFREVLYNSNVRFTTLTPEYNCRFNMGAMVSHNVKILHGRHEELSAIKNKINDSPINKWSQEPIIRWIKY